MPTDRANEADLVGHLDTPVGGFDLSRHHHGREASLRAWDAADEYLLDHLDQSGVELTGSVLIINDAWGALTCALAASNPITLSDSVMAWASARHNLSVNGIDDSTPFTDGLAPLPGPVDVVVMKVPRTSSLLEDQLHRLRPHLHPGTVVVAGAMTKHIHNSTSELFGSIIGPTRTTLARKKARLVLASFDPTLEVGASPWPTSFTIESGATVVNHAGVFSEDHLDIGTRLLLQHLPDIDDGHVIDLGCGNGVVGLMAAMANPTAQVTFIDDSSRAVASARATWAANLGDRPAAFLVSDGLFRPAVGAPLEPGQADVVLVNPPFHLDHVIGDATAWQMFTESRRTLRPGGEIRVVGNRHLGYHAKLQKIFGNCELLASDPKFVVLRAGR